VRGGTRVDVRRAREDPGRVHHECGGLDKDDTNGEFFGHAVRVPERGVEVPNGDARDVYRKCKNLRNLW
jgi:hypothetical protein